MKNDRRPSRIPVRGSLVLALTIGGMALLMGFRAPEDPTADVALAIEPGSDSAAEAPATGSDPGGSAASASPPGSSDSASPSPAVSAAAGATESASPAASVAPTLEPTASPSPTTAATQTATGNAYQFRYGIVQVAVTVQGGDIIDVQALQLPDGDRRSRYISQQVEPMLRESALAADSANIDVISGATYTSTAYAYSLQSALDQLAAA